MSEAIKSISYAETAVKTIDNIFNNIYRYKGKNYAVRVCDKVYLREVGLSLFIVKAIIKELERLGLVKRTLLRLKNAPLEFKMLVVGKQDLKRKNSRGHLQTPIYLCQPDKLKEYRDMIERQFTRRTE